MGRIAARAAFVLAREASLFDAAAVQRQRAHVLIMPHAGAAGFRHLIFTPFLTESRTVSASQLNYTANLPVKVRMVAGWLREAME
jgi:hypothetical protein